MNVSLETLSEWSLWILAALNLAAIALWIASARFRVVLGRRVPAASGGERDTVAGPPERETAPQVVTPESEAPEGTPPPSETRTANANRGEARLAQDLERWRRRMKTVRAEAGA